MKEKEFIFNNEEVEIMLNAMYEIDYCRGYLCIDEKILFNKLKAIMDNLNKESED